MQATKVVESTVQWLSSFVAVAALGCSGVGIETEGGRPEALSGSTEVEWILVEDDIWVPVEGGSTVEKSRRGGQSFLIGTRAGEYDGKTPSNIGFSYASSVPTRWRIAFNEAAAVWSQLPNVDIFARNRGDSISITTASLGVSSSGLPRLADARLPLRGKVGNRIRIDLANTAGQTAAQRRTVALHELGHALGLKHPGEGFLIAGMANTTATVMTAQLPPLPVLRFADRRAIELLYGRPTRARCNSRGMAFCRNEDICVHNSGEARLRNCDDDF